MSQHASPLIASPSGHVEVKGTDLPLFDSLLLYFPRPWRPLRGEKLSIQRKLYELGSSNGPVQLRLPGSRQCRYCIQGNSQGFGDPNGCESMEFFASRIVKGHDDAALLTTVGDSRRHVPRGAAADPARVGHLTQV